MMSTRSLAAAAATSLLLFGAMSLFARPAAATPPRGSDAALETGRELSQLFLRGDTDAVWARMAPAMREALGDAPALAQFHAKIASELGEEQAVIGESTRPQDGMQAYARTSRWSRMPSPVLMQWVFDGDGRIAGFVVRPAPQAAPTRHLDYQTKAALPFDGTWYVVWGGRTLEQNYHAASPGQRFAYDMLQRVDGQTHRGDGKALDDYYCWDEKVLAPAAASVVEVVDGLPDQAIGTRNPEAPAGNHVMLDLGQGEYALLAHLRRGSVAVKPGQRVASGDELGRCGNSGNTSEPHLHVHLQDSPVFGKGDGLPAFFNHYTADGREVARGEPAQGQVVVPLTTAPTR